MRDSCARAIVNFLLGPSGPTLADRTFDRVIDHSWFDEQSIRASVGQYKQSRDELPARLERHVRERP